MTSCVRILSTQAVDSFPSILLVAPNGKKILVNCGEGCQRIFLEFGQKVSTIDMVCITHLGHETIGGLPGMILTASDVIKIATDHAKEVARPVAIKSTKSQKKQQIKKRGHGKQNKTSGSSSLPIQPGLKLLGPNGTYKFFRSLRHFMKRDSFSIDIREGASIQGGPKSNSEVNSSSHTKKNGKKKKIQSEAVETDNDSFIVQSFSAYTRVHSNTNTGTSFDSAVFPSKKRPRTTKEGENDPLNTTNTTTIPYHSSSHHQRPHQSDSREILSFLFTTPPIQGRFLIEKAKALGVPRGPLYGQLKAGKTVTFSKDSSAGYINETTTVTVESSQVVEPGSPGVVVAVLCYPYLDILNQLKKKAELKQFKCQIQENVTFTEGSRSQKMDQNNKNPILELIVHITTKSIFDSDSCVTWRESFFQKSVRHVFVRNETTSTDVNNDSSSFTLSAFQSAHSGANLRSKISLDVFKAPLEKFVKDENDATVVACQRQRNSPCVEATKKESPHVVHAVPLLEYVLLPRAKRGFSNHDLFFKKWMKKEEEAQALLNSSGCIDRANQILQECRSLSPIKIDIDESIHNNKTGEILFTGTGSAVPCKHRNVSGIYVRMDNGNSILLDVGEGTIGQLLRTKQRQDYRGKGEESLAAVLKNIKAVWISHPHADHHLGILRLLEERKRLVDNRDPLVLIAAPNILRFLQEYESVEPRVANSYIFLDCRTLTTNESGSSQAGVYTNQVALQRLQEDLGIHSCTTIPVAHCAYSFAVVFHGTSFGSLAYSGDCRPSKDFAEIAYNADLLIHEATFADGMEADAVVKRHCTVGEALQVAKNMNAKTTILTHFSQRYPKVPLLRTVGNIENRNTSNTNTGSSSYSLPGMRVIHAFDFMSITPSNIAAASMLIPALQMLYPDKSDDLENSVSKEKSDAQVALEVPGLFAQSELL